VDWIGCGSEYTELSWIGLDWVIKLLDWVGLDLAKWTRVQLRHNVVQNLHLRRHCRRLDCRGSVWLSGSALVVLRRARLVLGWVTRPSAGR